MLKYWLNLSSSPSTAHVPGDRFKADSQQVVRVIKRSAVNRLHYLPTLILFRTKQHLVQLHNEWSCKLKLSTLSALDLHTVEDTEQI